MISKITHIWKIFKEIRRWTNTCKPFATNISAIEFNNRSWNCFNPRQLEWMYLRIKIKLAGTPWKQGLKCAQHVSIQASDILMMKHAAGINNYIYNKYSACTIKNRNIQLIVPLVGWIPRNFKFLIWGYFAKKRLLPGKHNEGDSKDFGVNPEIQPGY